MTLTDLRRAVSMTQDELAQKVGVTKTTISAWERGAAVPRLRHERGLAEALQTTLADIKVAITEGAKTKTQVPPPAKTARKKAVQTA